MAQIINLQNVSVVRDQAQILTDINWQVEDNQRWVIIGPNGAGKTSLLRVVSSQMHPTSGNAQILGQQLGEINVFELRTRIGFASSAVMAHIPNSETVLDVVMTASYGITGRWNEKYEDIDERRARRVLSEWHLGDYADRAYGTLSDGERKRTQIARAVMPDPELLLLDEPVASLDLAAREQTIHLLGQYAQSPAAPAMIMVTHHLEEIPTGFTHALIINDGRVFAAGEINSTLTTEKISEAFGMSLQIDQIDGRYRARVR